jgi:hypothetical protein
MRVDPYTLATRDDVDSHRRFTFALQFASAAACVNTHPHSPVAICAPAWLETHSLPVRDEINLPAVVLAL